MKAWGGALAALCLVVSLTPAAYAQPPPSCDGRPATIVGTEGPDVLEGTPDHDVIAGLGGDDTIRGMGTTDRICGGPGDDTLEPDGSGEIPDELPEDVLFGEDGDDVLYGGGDWTMSHGGLGDDVFIGGPVSFERSPGPVLADTLAGDAFGEGRDMLIDVRSITGSAFSDGLRGTERIETFEGGDGDDRLIGLGGRDYLYGAVGDDVVSGGPGGDLNLHGGEGDDEIYGGTGPDYLYGETYDDVDLGDDLLFGGDGRDKAVFRVTDSAGVTVDLRADSALGHGSDVLDSIEDVEGSDGPDSIVGDKGPNHLAGGEGADLVYGLAGNDHLDPSEFDGFAHRKDQVRGGRGRDFFVLGECCGGITLYGGRGRDLASLGINGGGPGVVVDLAEGTYAFERMNGRLASIEGVWGTARPDVLLGDAGPNLIKGDYESDVLRGRAGDDVLFGGGKHDEVYGGPGRDRCRDPKDRLSGCERTPD